MSLTDNRESETSQHDQGAQSLAVTVNDLTVAYRSKPVLWDIDLNVPSGVLMAILGPNGAGKTTLLKAMLGLIPPAAGHVKILDRSYHEVHKRVGYVPQRGSVDWDFPTTVLDVVTMGAYGRIGWFKRPSKTDRGDALAALGRVGMDAFANRQISQLSGGQQQRVFLARALLQNADIYFMDEPFQGVDATTERAIIAILHEIKDAGKTVIVVHHDLQTVEEYFDWALLLNVRAIASGPVNDVFTADLLRQTYGGKISFIEDMQRYRLGEDEAAVRSSAHDLPPWEEWGNEG